MRRGGAFGDGAVLNRKLGQIVHSKRSTAPALPWPSWLLRLSITQSYFDNRFGSDLAIIQNVK